jgi:hypothetical protein
MFRSVSARTSAISWSPNPSSSARRSSTLHAASACVHFSGVHSMSRPSPSSTRKPSSRIENARAERNGAPSSLESSWSRRSSIRRANASGSSVFTCATSSGRSCQARARSITIVTVDASFSWIA